MAATWFENTRKRLELLPSMWRVGQTHAAPPVYTPIEADGEGGRTVQIGALLPVSKKLDHMDRLTGDPGCRTMNDSAYLVALSPALMLQAAESLDTLSDVFPDPSERSERVARLMLDLENVLTRFGIARPEPEQDDDTDPAADALRDMSGESNVN